MLLILQRNILKNIVITVSSKSKRKGYRFEKEIENIFREEGHKALRTWGSNGRSMGVDEDVDVIVNDEFYIQAKRRKKLPSYMELGNCHAVFVREDRGDLKVLIPFDFFIEMYNEWNQ